MQTIYDAAQVLGMNLLGYKMESHFAPYLREEQVRHPALKLPVATQSVY